MLLVAITTQVDKVTNGNIKLNRLNISLKKQHIIIDIKQLLIINITRQETSYIYKSLW